MKTLRNSRKFRLYKQARKEFCSRYPGAFPWSGRRPPLRIGILDDIRSRGEVGLSMTSCRRFLSIWTSSTAYLSNMSAGTPRVGLDGTACGSVSEAHQGEARDTLARRKARRRLTSATAKT